MKSIPVRRIESTLKEPAFVANFGIRNLHQVLKGKDMVQELHRHDFYYVLAIEKGQGSNEIDFTPYPIRNHSVFVMAPGQVHCLNLKASSTGYLVGFKPEFFLSYNKEFNQLLRRAASINLHHGNARTFKKLLPLLATMFQEYTLKHEQYEEVIKATMNVFFIELTRHNSHINSIGKNRYQQQTLERFLELVETHITTHKHMSQYAAMLNLSSFQLNAITKTLRGKTSSQIITEYIILESKRYLLASTSQVTQIAYQLGYEDASYFIRFFKKNTGYTPDVFRHNFR